MGFVYLYISIIDSGSLQFHHISGCVRNCDFSPGFCSFIETAFHHTFWGLCYNELRKISFITQFLLKLPPPPVYCLVDISNSPFASGPRVTFSLLQRVQHSATCFIFKIHYFASHIAFIGLWISPDTSAYQIQGCLYWRSSCQSHLYSSSRSIHVQLSSLLRLF